MFPVDRKGVSVVKVTSRRTPIGELNSISAEPCDSNGFVKRVGTEDNTYRCYPSLVHILPCGLTFLDDKCVIRGERFSKADVNDDNADNIVVTERNGRMIFISVARVDGVMYMFGGSKNVLDCFRVGDDVNDMDPRIVDIFKVFLSIDIDYDIVENKTICGDFSEGSIKWFNVLNNDDQELLEPLKWLGAVNLDTVKSHTVNVSCGDIFRDDLRMKWGIQGYVMYWRVGDRVTCLEKLETLWYTMLCLTQQVIQCNQKIDRLANFRQNLKTAIFQHNQKYMRMDDAFLWKWYHYMSAFYDWFAEQVPDSAINGNDGIVHWIKQYGILPGAHICVKPFLPEYHVDKTLVVVQGLPGMMLSELCARIGGGVYTVLPIDKVQFRKIPDIVETVFAIQCNFNRKRHSKLVSSARKAGWAIAFMVPLSYDRMWVHDELCGKYEGKFKMPSDGYVIEVGPDHIADIHHKSGNVIDDACSAEIEMDPVKWYIHMIKQHHMNGIVEVAGFETAKSTCLMRCGSGMPVSSDWHTCENDGFKFTMYSKQPLYIGYFFSKTTRDRLIEIVEKERACEELNDVIGGKLYLDHVTLISSKNVDDEYREMWKELCNESETGRICGRGLVIVHGITYSDIGHVRLDVHVDRGSYVASQKPHITVCVPKSQQPFSVVDMLGSSWIKTIEIPEVRLYGYLFRKH